MLDYNPTAPNELADAQLNREKYESNESKAVATHAHHVNYGAIDGKKPFDYGPGNKESYNSIPGE